MTQTLQERLRNHPSHQCSKVRDEAADRIDALERALREIANEYPKRFHSDNRNDLIACNAVNIARAALTPSERKDSR